MSSIVGKFQRLLKTAKKNMNVLFIFIFRGNSFATNKQISRKETANCGYISLLDNDNFSFEVNFCESLFTLLNFLILIVLESYDCQIAMPNRLSEIFSTHCGF